MAEAKNKKISCIKVELYEKNEGKLGKKSEVIINTSDTSLHNILKDTLTQEWSDVSLENIKCQSGNIRGEYINLESKPTEVSYIIDTFRKKQVPTLILLKENNSASPPPLLSPSPRPHRTLSNFLREMIGDIYNPSPPDFEMLEECTSPLSSPSSLPMSPTIEIQGPSIDLSTENNPGKIRRKKFGKSSRSISMITSIDTNNDDDYDELTVASPPRPRAIVLSQRPYESKGDSFTQEKSTSSLKKRKTVFSFGGSTDSKKEESESPLEISGPEQHPFDWKSRKTGAVRTTRKGNDKRPKKEATIIPGVSYSDFEIHKIMIQLEESESSSFNVNCREFETVGALKNLVQQEMRRKNLVVSDDHFEFTLTYKLNGTVYELFNERQLIYKTKLYQHWKETGSTTTPVNIELKGNNVAIPTLVRISKLTGVLLDEVVTTSCDSSEISHLVKIAKNDRIEVEWTRRTLHSYVNEVVKERNPSMYALSMELETGEAPMRLAFQTPYDNKIEVNFHYKSLFSLVRKVNVNQYASTLLKDIFPCIHACGLVEDDINKYTLQITGEQSYLDGENELISFKDIRKSILKSEPIHLSVTAKPTPEEDNICSLNWLPIDPFSGQPPLHTDIARKQKSDITHEVFAASVWDQVEEFALIVSQINNLPIPTTKESKKIQVIVTATIYHANQPLSDVMRTNGHLLNINGSIECHETLLFGLQIKNLPKAAKIMVCVQDDLLRKDSAKKRISNILYWGLVPVFDHRGILQTGSYTMTLWKGPTYNSKLNYGDCPSFNKNPCAPCNSNPDPNAVQVTIQFPRYTYPVFFPSSAPETCSFLLSHEKDSSVVPKKIEKLKSLISNAQLPMSAFPSYIALIEWAKLPQVIEVYSLLEQVEAEQNLPVETALKLLDGEFADEKVRGFAVRVLDTLPDEKLETFLLQLTQAIKFEPCHDSALGRLLLKRALNNKRIGHFFFWYLKCEMYNPLFTPRFGVLLEAYLKGCGESMLTRFENQMEMQTKLEEIGKQVEELGGNDVSKMQSVLQDLLQRHGIPEKQLTPVYNPRIVLGQLAPTKCKIMASKKKPQWLEMYNVDPSSLRSTPTRLILKLGDDLRQDVIVLRMLSLFEKLWEEDGLPDLCLIPYGCMATGPNSGFIEVVKNARTIANVSGINDTKKLYEWIKSHQKNEFGEDDPDILKESIKRFMYSCAGYTVASYVLGIGDRHNDNIMITTSGNLFHIDFGHFLGNIKHFLGVKREWAPFVLTPDFVYVMGGEDSETFNTYKNLCCRAFLCLRRHHELIFNLFSLMRSTGIPELACVEDANYIRDALMLTKLEHEAEQAFKQLIKKCLDLQWTVQIMWWIHKHRAGGSSS